MRWGMTAGATRLWGSRDVLGGPGLVSRSLLGVDVVGVRRGRVDTRLLGCSRSAVVTRRVDVDNVILGSVGLLGCRTTVATTLPAAGGSGCRLRGGLTHGFKRQTSMTGLVSDD